MLQNTMQTPKYEGQGFCSTEEWDKTLSCNLLEYAFFNNNFYQFALVGTEPIHRNNIHNNHLVMVL